MVATSWREGKQKEKERLVEKKKKRKKKKGGVTSKKLFSLLKNGNRYSFIPRLVEIVEVRKCGSQQRK